MNNAQSIPSFRDPNGVDSVVFLNWDWSGQAQQGKRIFEYWVSVYHPTTPTFIVSLDDDKETWPWMESEQRRIGHLLDCVGSGGVLFTRKGHVIGWIERVFLMAPPELEAEYQKVYARVDGSAGAKDQYPGPCC